MCKLSNVNTWRRLWYEYKINSSFEKRVESPRGRSQTNRVRTHRLSIWANIFFFFLGCPDSGHGVRIFALLNGDRRSSLLSPSHGSRGWSPVTAKPVVLPPALAKRNPQKELQFAVGRRCASAPRIPPSDCEFTVMQKRRFFRPTIRHDSENVTLASASQGCHDVTPPPLGTSRARKCAQTAMICR